MSDSEQQEIERLLQSKPASIEELIDEMSMDVYAALKLALELSKWPDGKRLEAQQRDFCMQAIILFEAKHLPEHDRIGFDLSANCKSGSAQSKSQTIVVGEPAGSTSREGSQG